MKKNYRYFKASSGLCNTYTLGFGMNVFSLETYKKNP